MSAMRSSLAVLLDKLGIGDIVLPFLLVFSIVFAILEKTKVFGVEKVGNQVYTRKNINAMVAFVVAFFVVLSNKLVQVITKTTSNAVLLLLLSVLFLMLYGSFKEESDKGVSLSNGWGKFFEWIMAIGICVIFLDSMTTSSGESWLSVIWGGLVSIFTSNSSIFNGQFFESIVLLLVIIGVIAYIVHGEDHHTDSNSESKEE